MSDWVHRTLPTEVRQLLLLAMAPWCQQVHVPEPIKILDIQHLEWGTRILFSTGEHRVSLGIFWGGMCLVVGLKSIPKAYQDPQGALLHQHHVQWMVYSQWSAMASCTICLWVAKLDPQ